MEAARWGQTDTVVELMKEGGDIHMQNKVCCLFSIFYMYIVVRIVAFITQYGDTALILASGKCKIDAILLLLKAGASVNLQNNVCWCCV